MLPSGDNIQQDPDRSGVLHDDGGGDVRSLNGDVIEIVRDGYPKRAQNDAIGEITDRELDSLPTF